MSRAEQRSSRFQVMDLLVYRLEPCGRAAAVAPNAIQLQYETEYQGDLGAEDNRGADGPKLLSARMRGPPKQGQTADNGHRAKC